ncbi:hypothetical protein ACFWAY_37740 [Rhodococcus sp. NPDC059968]|uniref:hypothetical protein n=1 Tax=Rhodococcus sp. NPDC059968 TaxID=3347017 RepID=UPI00366CD8C5
MVETLGAVIEEAGNLWRAIAADIEAGSGDPHFGFEVVVRLRRTSQRSRRLTELATHMAFPQSSMTRLIDELGAAGFVEPTGRPADRPTR